MKAEPYRKVMWKWKQIRDSYNNLGGMEIKAALNAQPSLYYLWQSKSLYCLFKEPVPKLSLNESTTMPLKGGVLFLLLCLSQWSTGASIIKNHPGNAWDARDAGSIPGSWRSPGVGNNNLFQYPGLGDLTGRGAWLVHGVAKSWIQLRKTIGSLIGFFSKNVGIYYLWASWH